MSNSISKEKLIEIISEWQMRKGGIQNIATFAQMR